MKIVASCNTMAGLVWKCMQFWEHTACVPRVLQNCKLRCIPKKDQRQLKPCQFRPICVFSIWWRAWSSTWLRAEVNKKWTQEVFPMNVAGGLQGSPGPEEIASVVAHQLAHLGHGVSLDLSHAFDAVDLKMMDGALSALLPEECRPWKTLLLLGRSVLVITSWATYNICYNKLVEVSMVELSRALAALSKSN